MRYEEYVKGMDNIAVSSADKEIKEAAVARLQFKYYGVSADRQAEILKDIEVGSADTSDMGGMN